MNSIVIGETIIARSPIITSLDEVRADLTRADITAITALSNPRRQLERATVMSLIRRLLGNDVDLGHDVNGAPLIIGRDINISISHSRADAVVALDSSRRVGIDTETWRDQLTRVAGKFLSPAELQVYTTPRLLLRAWTVKEAVYKAASIPGLPFIGGIILDTSSPEATAATVCSPNIPGHAVFRLHFLPTPQDSATTLAIPENAI